MFMIAVAVVAFEVCEPADSEPGEVHVELLNEVMREWSSRAADQLLEVPAVAMAHPVTATCQPLGGWALGTWESTRKYSQSIPAFGRRRLRKLGPVPPGEWGSLVRFPCSGKSEGNS